MYRNNSYEEYMRNFCGCNNINNNQMHYEDENIFTYNQLNVDNMYPEIYKIVYPMICKACMGVQENISEDLVSRITNEIYINVEQLETNTSTEARERNIGNLNNINQNDIRNGKIENQSAKMPSNNTVNPTRIEKRTDNFLLKDLIRILVLRELLGNPSRPSQRPNYNLYNEYMQRSSYMF